MVSRVSSLGRSRLRARGPFCAWSSRASDRISSRPTRAPNTGGRSSLRIWSRSWRGQSEVCRNNQTEAPFTELRRVNVTNGENINEDQVDQRVRRHPGKGSTFLYRNAWPYQEGRFQQRAVSMADRRLTRRTRRNRATTRSQRQPGGQ